jgi:hypothetical protein
MGGVMPRVMVEDLSLELDLLSPEVRAKVEMVLAAEARILELKRDLEITEAARDAYISAIKSVLHSGSAGGR